MIFGIDVSEHNNVTSWKSVKNAGKDFVFIRLGWCGNDGRIVAHGGLNKKFTNTWQRQPKQG